MKIDKQSAVVTGLDHQGQRAPLLRENSAVKARRTEPRQDQLQSKVRQQGKGASFNLQLNQQLSSMQSAESYLDQLSNRLQQLKMSLSRELGSSQPAEREALKQSMREIEQLLEQRDKHTAGTLDANLRLRLSEPARSRFAIDGLDTLEQVRYSGKETLIFHAGRQLNEPLAVVLDEGLSTEQVLRRFNASLGQAGIRAEVEADGVLKFSIRESDWQELRGQLSIQGEGKLASKTPARVQAEEDALVKFPKEISADSHRELRRVLDDVVAGIDRVTSVREQIIQRKKEIREFLAKQNIENESQWASDYVGKVFDLMQRGPHSYSAVSQTVVAQANLTRYSVVGLLS